MLILEFLKSTHILYQYYSPNLEETNTDNDGQQY